MSNFKFYINDGDGIIKNNLFGSTQTSGQTPKARNGAEVAAALVNNLYVTQKGSYKDLTDKWDITNVGSELIFTSKAEKAYKDAQFKVNENENRAEVKGEMIFKNLGNEPFKGQKEINEFTITNSAVSNGELIVTVDDGSIATQIIKVAKGDTKEIIATKISEAFQDLANWEVKVTVGTSTVVFTAKSNEDDKNVKITISNKK